MWLARGTVLLTAIALASAGAAQAAPPRVTFIADSVADVLLYNPGPFHTLGDGLDLQILAQPCRKLIDPGCQAENSDHPPSALDTIRQVGAGLGSEVVLEVGYNDFYDSFAAGLDPVMNALVAAGVQHVVWVTLVENQGNWAQMNELIRALPARWPQVTVADWAPVAAGQTSWFVDAAHMHVAAARFTPASLIAVATRASAPGSFGISMTRSNGIGGSSAEHFVRSTLPRDQARVPERPPSTKSPLPSTNRDSSEARYRIAFATSSGLPNSPVSWRALTARSPSCGSAYDASR